MGISLRISIGFHDFTLSCIFVTYRVVCIHSHNNSAQCAIANILEKWIRNVSCTTDNWWHMLWELENRSLRLISVYKIHEIQNRNDENVTFVCTHWVACKLKNARTTKKKVIIIIRIIAHKPYSSENKVVNSMFILPSRRLLINGHAK